MRRALLADLQVLLNSTYALPVGTMASLSHATLAGVLFTHLEQDNSGQISFACSCMGHAYTQTSDTVAGFNLQCAG